MAEAVSKTKNMSGVDRAAVFLLALGEKEAAEVLKHLGAKDVQKVGAAMARLGNVSRKQLEAVMEDFSHVVEEQTSLGLNNEDYIRSVLVNALGQDKAGNLIDRILAGSNSKGLESLKWMDPRAIAELVRREHPQIIAIVLAYLESDQAAEVLAALPENLRGDIVLRIATMDGIPPSALHQLDEILEKQSAQGSGSLKSSNLGGVKVAADILNLIDSSSEEKILGDVGKHDEALSQRIQELMFVFDNLLEVEDRGIQTILRDVPTESLVIALKGADSAIREKFFRNMSERAAEILRDDLEVRGPVKLSEVEAAQKEILAIARKLAESGAIQLGGKGEEYV